MKSALLGVVAVALAWSAGGCNNPLTTTDQSFVFNVSKIDAPASIAPGTSLSVVLTAVSGGCARFDHIETQKNASGASITVWGLNPAIGNPGMPCTQDIRNELHTLTFDPPFAATFTVSVNRPQLDPLTATVQVQ